MLFCIILTDYFNKICVIFNRIITPFWILGSHGGNYGDLLSSAAE
jgi:hypothetical protein